MKKDARTVVREFLDAFNANNLERAVAHCSKDAKMTIIPLGAEQSVRDDFRMWKEAFPDSKLQVTHIVAQENSVVVECVGRGTHKGVLRTPKGNIPPKNRKVELPFIQTFELQNGHIVGVRMYFDSMELFRRLGVGEPTAVEAETASP